MDRLADVIIDRVAEGLDHVFTYRVPDALRHDIQVGQWVRVPFRHGRVRGVVSRLYDDREPPGTKAIEAIEDAEAVLTPALVALAEWMADRYLCYLPQAVRAIVPAPVRSGAGRRSQSVWYQAVGERKGRPSLKHAVFSYCRAEGLVSRETLLARFPHAERAIRSLVAEGALAVVMSPPVAVAAEIPVKPPELTLTAEQQRACDAMLAVPGRSWLLEGVTGSGKTEVYLTLIQHALETGRQALVLLPEIALTPQTVTRFRHRFGSAVAVWHSGLTATERRRTWDLVRRGGIGVVVGARSAVFLPFPALGVIVVDEEHEPTYKQEEHPRYHTRDVALWRGAREGATVVLGSATPSVEARYAAEQGILGHLRLTQRVWGKAMPTVELVDMREELKAGHRSIFSRRLIEAMTHTLERGEQAILFLNRRGYSTFVLCRSCGQALECPDCAVSLTYHQEGERLMCHYCLKTFPVPTRCPQCQSEKIRYFGAGTERVVSEVSRLFPRTRVLRADRDVLTRPEDYSTLYQRFYRGEADILVGTQMIAKGMDFPRVSLVGIVAADTALHLPDYRSAERTFQLLVQAAGRSGRGTAPGQVVVQTYNPVHYAIARAEHHDYNGFYQEELRYRQETSYPPYTQLWLLLFRGIDESVVRDQAGEAKAVLETVRGAVDVLGPAPAPLVRVRGEYRYQLLIKVRPLSGVERELTATLKQLRGAFPNLSVTRDPYFFM
ncbi:MAG: primosomal protein N' [Firmicutes bacterium]|nr:primosomal protein N' [Bacillota bacterium]